MMFDSPLEEAVLLRRYKRFLADVRFPDGQETTVHVPNTGSMRGCSDPGSRVWLSSSSNPSRKYRQTLEIVESGGVLAGVNTSRSNFLVREALDEKLVDPLSSYTAIRAEQCFEDSRFDFFLEGTGIPCWLEVKNVTLVEDGVAVFPDAITKRGRKHLLTLESALRQGYRAVIFYLIQRKDGHHFAPAEHIDPTYAQILRHAFHAGVEVLAYRADVSPRGIRIRSDQQVPVQLHHSDPG